MEPTAVVRRVHRVLTALVLVLLATACGGGDDQDAGPLEGHDSHGADSHASDSHDHDHDHGALSGIPLDDLAEPPTVAIAVEPDGEGGVTVEVVVDGIELVSTDPPVDHRPGQGHLHVSVDGTTVAMTAETVVYLRDLVDGHHEVAVRLSANDHRDYLLDGSPIGDADMVVVTGGRAPAVADRAFAVEVVDGKVVGGLPRFEASIGDLVEVAVASDVEEEVHLHAYDVTVTVPAGGRGVLRVEATIPGVFEAELHGSGLRVFELQVS